MSGAGDSDLMSGWIERAEDLKFNLRGLLVMTDDGHFGGRWLDVTEDGNLRGAWLNVTDDVGGADLEVGMGCLATIGMATFLCFSMSASIVWGWGDGLELAGISFLCRNLAMAGSMYMLGS